MTSTLVALVIAANSPERLAAFWGGLLGWDRVAGRGRDDDGAVELEPADDTGFRLRFEPTDRPKTRPNQMHLDLTSRSSADQQATVARALALGGRPIDVGQRPEEQHVVLADPEGNELCVVEPGNAFLADCGRIGAVSCDGSQQTGHFWSHALGWPLVWDQDEETAIRAPYGGPKISWGGPPLSAKAGRYRLRFDLVATGGLDLEREVDRLLALGAERCDQPPDASGRVWLTDPDGHELSVRGSA